jgi:hypothetical protein
MPLDLHGRGYRHAQGCSVQLTGADPDGIYPRIPLTAFGPPATGE